MGFLKFLKKKKEMGTEEGLEDLDIPPAPPSIKDEDIGLGSLGEELPEPPELPELPKIEEEAEEEKISGESPEEEILERITPEIPSFKPERFVPLEDIEKRPAREEKAYLEELHEHKGITKPIFIQLNNYKYVLDEIEMIKGHLDNFETVAAGLNELKEDKDKRFAKWNDHFKDIQKKLIFVDKTLFAK